MQCLHWDRQWLNELVPTELRTPLEEMCDQLADALIRNEVIEGEELARRRRLHVAPPEPFLRVNEM
jgi:hypothetical protein